MSSVNKVILIGNLGADPELSFLPSGGAVANIRLATTLRWKDKQTGEMKEETEWHRITAYDRLAEIAAEHYQKGKKIYVEGRIRTKTWTDKDNVQRYMVEIIASSMQSLSAQNQTAEA